MLSTIWNSAPLEMACKQSEKSVAPTSAPADSCDPNPCHNGGTCFHVADTYNCSCPRGFTGDDCEAEILPSVNVPLIAGIVCAVIFAVCLIAGAAFFIHRTRKNRRLHGTYSPSKEEQQGCRVDLSHVLKPPPIERLI